MARSTRAPREPPRPTRTTTATARSCGGSSPPDETRSADRRRLKRGDRRRPPRRARPGDRRAGQLDRDRDRRADVEPRYRRGRRGGAGLGGDASRRARAESSHAGAARDRGHVDELAELLTREQGKPLSGSRKEILFGAEVLHYYAEEARRSRRRRPPGASAPTSAASATAPVGVWPPDRARGTTRSTSAAGRSRRPWRPAAR